MDGPITDEDQRRHDEIALEVGRALDVWSGVEHGLADVFQQLSGIPAMRTAHAVMASIVNFEARLSILNTLVKLSPDLPEHRKQYWNSLYNRLTKQYKKRHEIAHFTIVKFLWDKGAEWRLAPFFSWGLIAKNPGAYEVPSMSASDIRQRAQKFEALCTELRWFETDLKHHAGIFPTNYLPEPDLARQLREQAAQTPAGNKPPPQS